VRITRKSAKMMKHLMELAREHERRVRIADRHCHFANLHAFLGQQGGGLGATE